MIINGALTNYDAGTQTLHKSTFAWVAAHGASATTLVLGGGKPFDIVTSEASLALFGPKTGFRDRFGNNALRNLAVSARLLIGDRDFTTATSFTSTSRLSVFGDCRFTVSGHLTIRNGFFEVSPLNGYAAMAIRVSHHSVQKLASHRPRQLQPAFTSHSPLSRSDHKKTATVNVKGAAVFAGTCKRRGKTRQNLRNRPLHCAHCRADQRAIFQRRERRPRRCLCRFDHIGNPQGIPSAPFS